MDKLQPILAHRFWIALGLTFCLALGAWYVGTGALSTQIAADQSAVDAITVPTGAGAPNPSWSEEAQTIWAERDADLKRAARTLAGTQEDLRIWPEGYRPYVEGLGYFEEIKNRLALEAYQDFYQPQINELRQSLNPYDFETQTGAISVPEGVLPQFDTSNWGTIPPLSMTIWSAQEDLWLMKELLAQVTKVNGESNSILNSPLKEIQDFKLRGGVGLAPAANSEGGPPPGEGGPPLIAPPPESRGEQGDELQFTLNEEIGVADGLDEDPNLIPPGMAPSPEGGDPNADPNYDPNAGLNFGGNLDPAPGGQQLEFVSPGGGRRYITSDVNVPYRTRAFRIRLVLDHREVPTVLADLSNSKWPVEIVRVHLAETVSPVGERAAASSPDGTRPPGLRPPGLRPQVGRLGGPARGPGDRGRLGQPNVGRGTEIERTLPDASDPYQVAMSDPYLATVVIGGVMTIFKPRPADEVLEEPVDPSVNLTGETAPGAAVNPTAVGVPADPAATDPPVDPSATVPPADPAAVDAAAGEGAADLNFGGDAGAGGDEFNLNADPPTPGGAPAPGTPDADPPAAGADPDPVAAGAG